MDCFFVFCFFVLLFCLFFFFQLGPRFYSSDFIFDIWLGPENCGTLSLRNGPLVLAINVLSCTARESEEKGKKNATDALFVF